jgi:integrase
VSIQEYYTKSGKKRYRAGLEVGKKLDGTPDRRTKVCKSEKKAQQAEREFYIIKDKLDGRSDKDTFGTYVNEYYLPAKRDELRGLTIRGYESVINNHLLPTLSEYKLGDITPDVVQALITSRSSRKVATNTRDALRQILGHACDKKILKYTAASGRFNFPAKAATDRDNSGAIISDLAEHYRIIQIAIDNKEPILPILIQGFCFGLRKGESLGTDCTHINLKNREINVQQSYLHIKGHSQIEPLKNDHSRRTLPMSTKAYKYLQPLCKNRIGPLCIDRDRRITQQDATKLMQEFVEKYDLPKLTCQSLRHSFATAALKAGVPIELVSKMLGHKSIVTTWNRYVKPTLNDVKQVGVMLDKASSV